MNCTGGQQDAGPEAAGEAPDECPVSGRFGMAVPAGVVSSVRPTGTIFELEALEGLPCGCVAAAYRARPWDVAVVSLEAKGPHCILAGHASGQILRLGDPAEFDEEDDEE